MLTRALGNTCAVRGARFNAALYCTTAGLKASVTAITFVALGTSLPDTFASKSAAIGDSNADSAVRLSLCSAHSYTP